MPRPRAPWTPSDAQQALWPAVSGNAINGLGEPAPRRATPIYWHDPDRTVHGPLQRWFYTQNPNPLVAAARAERQAVLDAPIAPLAPTPATRSPREWSDGVKAAALANGADVVGIARMRPEWVFDGYPVPPQAWIVMIGVAHDAEAMAHAPDSPAAAEVIRQYARGNRAAKGVASWLRGEGIDAVPHGGPMAGPVVLIPPALAAGLGELGKHGSIIHPTLGSSFRLACVLTDAPLEADAPIDFGADGFCTHCRVCVDACPPDAIFDVKQLVRGETRWYVDFDACLPFFNEHQGCGICVAVCPWSLPGVAPRLVDKLARRRAPDASP